MLTHYRTLMVPYDHITSGSAMGFFNRGQTVRSGEPSSKCSGWNKWCRGGSPHSSLHTHCTWWLRWNFSHTHGLVNILSVCTYSPFLVSFGNERMTLNYNTSSTCISTLLGSTYLFAGIKFMKVGYVHIACIKYTDKATDFVMNNLPLSGSYHFLNIVSLKVHNHHKFMFTFGNTALYFQKKTGIQLVPG